jgi:hypothetical protein
VFCTVADRAARAGRTLAWWHRCLLATAFGHAEPLFNYDYPTILTMSSAFLMAVLVPFTDRSRLGEPRSTRRRLSKDG